MERFKEILYVFEPSADQVSSLARVVALARNNQARLTVMAVLPPITAGIGLPAGGPISAELQATVLDDRRNALEELVAAHRQGLEIRLDVRVGTVFLEVIRAVMRDSHDLVIKPAEDPGWVDRLFGSDDMHLLRKCPCPVWLMKPVEKLKYASIVAAVDFDPTKDGSEGQPLNRKILELASSIALTDFAKLHVVHVWDAPAEMVLRTWGDNPDEVILEYVEGERARHRRGMDLIRELLVGTVGREAYEYLSPQFHLLQGSAKTVIPEVAKHERADLVVMGTVARTGIAGLFIGNTAEAIVDQLKCSVLALKPPGFVSPVRLDE